MGGRRWDDIPSPPPQAYLTYYVPVSYSSKSNSLGCFGRTALIIGWIVLLFMLCGMCSCVASCVGC